MTGRVPQPRLSVEFVIGSSTASTSTSLTSVADVKLTEDSADGRAEFRVEESVNQRIENNCYFGKERREGCGQGRQP